MQTNTPEKRVMTRFSKVLAGCALAWALGLTLLPASSLPALAAGGARSHHCASMARIAVPGDSSSAPHVSMT